MHADADDPWSDPDDASTAVAVEIFSLLADTTRLRIVLALRAGELPVGEIAAQVNKSQAAVSQHLAKLRMSRVVHTRHQGARVFYRLSNDHALELIKVALFQAEHAVDESIKHHHEDGES